MSQTEILTPITSVESVSATDSNVLNKQNNNVMNRIAITKLNVAACCTHKNALPTDDTCQLCKQQLTAPSLENMQKGSLSVQLSIGNCGHCFHKTCIDSHLMKNLSCPIDKTPWTTNNNYTFPNVETNIIGNMTLVTNPNTSQTSTETKSEPKKVSKKEEKASSLDNKIKILNNLL